MNVRPLGCMERFFIIVYEMDYYYNVGFTIRYKIPLKLSFQSSTTASSIPDETKNTILRILYPVLERIILKEPSLSVALKDLYSSKPLFIRLPEIDLSRIVRFVIVNDDEIKQLLEKEHIKRFNLEDSSVPLWRIIIGIKGNSASKDKSSDWRSLV